MLDSPEIQSQSLRSCTGSTWAHSSWTGNSRACSRWTGSRMTHSLRSSSRAYRSWTGSRMTHSLRSSSRACSSWTGSRMTRSLRRSSRACSSWTGSSHKIHSPLWSPHKNYNPPCCSHRSHSPPWNPHRSHSWSRNRLAHSSTRACSSRQAHSSRSHSPHSQSHSPHSRSHSLQSSHSSPWFWWVEGGAGRGAGEREVQVWSFLSPGPLYACPGSGVMLDTQSFPGSSQRRLLRAPAAQGCGEQGARREQRSGRDRAASGGSADEQSLSAPWRPRAPSLWPRAGRRLLGSAEARSCGRCFLGLCPSVKVSAAPPVIQTASSVWVGVWPHCP
ncbi:uncharacterized protein LOC116418999 [Piliocolobus tephrosceles]|uniref:uncharacterized protein LOC116418999 n=1 Tax=Piliocolobus tephrosceles TaxID=591936 RepID=UPI0013012619|nr:uncharacterized protein LOC116418999 [Piliocolobus tephrosceles]